MRVKNLYLITLFQIATLCSWAQSIDDILEREKPEIINEEVTMIIDTDIPQGTTPEELEQTKQDSINQINEKKKNYLLGKNREIQQLEKTIQQTEASNITKEEIEDYELQANSLKEDFKNKKETNTLWQNNDELDELLENFNNNCSKVLKELNRLKEKTGAETPPNKLIILGICLAAIMVIVPIFTQVKSGVMMRKAKKQQEQQAKQQQEEMERQILLADDNTMITLKE
jgi:superfamily I DNA/RNA helicase